MSNPKEDEQNLKARSEALLTAWAGEKEDHILKAALAERHTQLQLQLITLRVARKRAQLTQGGIWPASE